MKTIKNVLLGIALIIALTSLGLAQTVKPITLDWLDNSATQQIQYYTVYQSTDNTNFTAVVDDAGDPIQYVESQAVISLEPGIYHFKVTATNVWGESHFSNTVPTPGMATAPQQLTFTITVTVP